MLNVYTGALAKLGSRIVNGGLEPDTRLTLEGLQIEFGVSRTIAREVVQVLASKGLVESRRRTGVRVLPSHDWDHYDPAIIRWRLDGDGRAAHLYELSQLRAAVEPPSSALAAVHADATVRAEIVRLAQAMETAGAAADLSTFLDLDIRFHRMLLAASGNVMFDALGDVVEEVLRGRTDHNLMPSNPKPTARRLHLLVAEGVARGDAQASQTAMQAICGEVVSAMQQPRPMEPEGRQSTRSKTVAEGIRREVSRREVPSAAEIAGPKHPMPRERVTPAGPSDDAIFRKSTSDVSQGGGDPVCARPPLTGTAGAAGRSSG